MHHGGGHRVGAHRQTAHRVVVFGPETSFFQHVQHDVADQGACLVMEGGSAHIDVEIRFFARCQRDVLVDHGEFTYQFGQARFMGVISHGASLPRAVPARRACPMTSHWTFHLGSIRV